MRTGAAFVIFFLLIAPSFASGTRLECFEGGEPSMVADLSGPGHSAVVNITMPAQCHVMNARMVVSNATSGVAPLVAPQVLLNGSVLWGFNAPDGGAFGLQDRFLDNASELRCAFPAGGGACETAIRLPKNAVVKDAGMEIRCSNDWNMWPTTKFSGLGQYEYYGWRLANAGDINGDGTDDVLVGAPLNATAGPMTGAVYAYFGGKAMNGQPDAIMTGRAAGDYFGISVSGAGDVNGDGLDDLIVGAENNASNGQDSGAAYIFFGGSTMDNSPDVVLAGAASHDHFGSSVSAAGDVNKDGYGDVIVGAIHANASKGRAYIFFGGSSMDNVTDITLQGNSPGEYFGNSVASAGDVNGDGCDDVIIGNYGNSGWKGQAYIFCGGSPMDNNTDVVLNGTETSDSFGWSVAGAGDVNSDGYDDVIVGADTNDAGGSDAGSAYVFLGGRQMDNTADVVLAGQSSSGNFGWSVSGAGDVNGDGFDDVIVGSPFDEIGGIVVGRTFIFFGGGPMDNIPDMIVKSSSKGEHFGYSVSGAGDMDHDGFDEVLVGAPENVTGGLELGAVFIYHRVQGIPLPAAFLGPRQVWANSTFCNATGHIDNFASALNSYLSRPYSYPDYVDSYGNAYMDVPIRINASGQGNITVSGISISYSCACPVADFSGVLDRYIAAHAAEKDANGNISVPFTVRSGTAGYVRLSGLYIKYDGPPSQIRPIPALTIDEDTANRSMLDLSQYFNDDYTSNSSLKFSIESASNSSIVNISVISARYLSVDAAMGDANDNWTGVVSVRVRCEDEHGFGVVSGLFDIAVRNVNDPPIIVSIPPANATAGTEFVYRPSAVDGDTDMVHFGLVQMPAGMTISSDGTITWMPTRSGLYAVTVVVDDGRARAYQNFTLWVPNVQPRFITMPVVHAWVGMEYVYEARAVDSNGDGIVFSLESGPDGMRIGSATGLLRWMPGASGNYEVSLSVSDWIDDAGGVYQNFSIDVSENHVPVIMSYPFTNATLGAQYLYEVHATDEDNDVLNFNLANKPAGMSIDSHTGRMIWTPSAEQLGNNTVTVKVSDQRGGNVEQTFVILVSPPERPDCLITWPSNGTRVHGVIKLKGTAQRGEAAIVQVRVRVQGGEWFNASGTGEWTLDVDTADMDDGMHRLEAVSFDGTDYSDTSSLTILVDNSKTPKPPGMGSGLALTAAVLVIAALAGYFLWTAERGRSPKQ